MILIRRHGVGINDVDDIIAGARGGGIDHDLLAGSGLRSISGGKDRFAGERILVHIHVVITRREKRDLDEQLFAGVIGSVSAQVHREDIAVDSVLTCGLACPARSA